MFLICHALQLSDRAMRTLACLFLIACQTAKPSTTPPTSLSAANLAVAVATGSITLNTPYRTVTFATRSTTGATLALSIGYGSAAFHDPSETASYVWTIGDRGPNFGCSDSNSQGAPYSGVQSFCTALDGTTDNDGVVFPTPNYSPTLYHFRIHSGAVSVLESIGLHDQNGEPISSLSPSFADPPYSSLGVRLPNDDNGLDPEGLVRLSDGTFWLSEEYAPSLVHVAADGTVLERVVPKGVTLAATYPITQGLPAVLSLREPNRGIESLGVSPDGSTLYFALQSPLANPNESAFKKSRNLRFYTVALDGDGSFSAVTHEYVYLLDTPALFGVSADKQKDISVSELTVLPDGRVVLDEHDDTVTTLARIDLSNATDILGTAIDSTLEQTLLGAQTAVVPLVKKRVFDSRTDAPGLPSKIEGVAILSATHALLVNDNDFGIDGAATVFSVLPIVSALTR